MSSRHAPPPPRGSEAYYSRIFETAEQETLNDMTPRLHALWEDYGWRSTVDVMTEWICSIDFIIPAKARYRDITGAVRMDQWNVEALLSEGFMLEQAVRAANERSQADGTPIHEEFAEASTVTTRLLENVNAWRPTLDQALRVASAERQRDPVRAVLVRGPGIRERDWWVLRDGAVYLFQLASWPIKAARQMGFPVRPPHMGWLVGDLSIPPNMALSLSPTGELANLTGTLAPTAKDRHEH